MVRQSKGKIFLAGNSMMQRSEGSRTHHYFTSGNDTFGSLNTFGEETLAEGCTLKIVSAADSQRIIVPLVGSVVYSDGAGSAQVVQPGEILVLHLQAGSITGLENNYDSGLISFLNIELFPGYPVERHILQVFRFDLNTWAGSNDTASMVRRSSGSLKIFPGFAIGKFEGRTDTKYEVTDASKGVFAFVIEGVFEVQGRLLHSRDSLALWENPVTDMEALSSGAIILLLEVDL